MAGRFSVEAVFKAIDRVTGPVRGMQRAVVRSTGRIERSLKRVGRMTDTVGAGIKRVGMAAVAAAAVAVPALVSIFRTGAEFEHALVSAGVKFPEMATKGTAAFEELKEAARDVGRTTEFTATQAAKGLGFLAMAGFDAQQSMAALPELVNLATASNLDLARASDIASDTLGAFGLMTKDTTQLTKNLTRVNDVLARTITSSNTDMEMLFETIQQAGPIATDAGASLENFSAIAGIMANSGIKASRAGTALKNMFVRLQAPPTEAAKALEKLGVNTTDAEDNFLGINNVIGQLLEKLPGVGKAQRAQALSAIFGLRAMAGSNVVISQGVDFLEQYQKNLENAAGTNKKMSDEIRGTMLGSWKALNSAVESVKLSIFDTTEGPLKGLIDRLTEWVRINEKLIAQRIGDFILSIVNNLPTIVKWLKRIGIGLGIFIAFSTVVKTLIGIFTLLNLVMAANPITLIIAGVAALVGAFAALVLNIDDVIGWFEKLPQVARFALAPFEGIVRLIKWIKEGIGEISSMMDGPAQALVGGVKGLFGFESDDPQPAGAGAGAGGGGPQVSDPQDRLTRSLIEVLTKEETEVTIRDETGRAEVTNGEEGKQLKIERSGET